MPENRSRYVVLCQQLLAFGTVLAVVAPAAGVATLDIVAPAPQTPHERVVEQAVPMALVASEPVEPEVTEVPIDGVEEAGLEALTRRPAVRRKAEADLAALSSPQPVEGYATVGVTWDPEVRLDEEEVSVEVRSRVDGAWSAWEQVEYHDEHGPDPDSAEGRRARQGTEPVIVGDVDEVQVKMVTADGEVPAGAELAVVNPGESQRPRLEQPAIDTAELAGEDTTPVRLSAASTEDPTTEEPSTDEPVTDGVLAGTPAYVTPKPQIFSRAQWGADERMRDKTSLSYYEVHAGFVHHTVNSNSYTRAQVPSLLRGILAYHTQSRGWSDIGYNFIVDRFGRIWEGRYGGVDRPVVGAHTLNYNEYSFAMSALGNFDTAQAPAAMVDAYARLFAWKLALHGVSASSTSQRVGNRTFPAINGHRDAGSTACPGRYLYAKLPQIRSLTAQYQKPFSSRQRSTDISGTPWPDLVVREAGTQKAFVIRTGGQVGFQRRMTAADGWKGMDLITAAGDLTGDGTPDVIARQGATGVTAVYPGARDAKVGTGIRATRRFSNIDQMASGVDVTGDGNIDVVARVATTKKLYVYPGNGRGGFRTRRLLSAAWGAYNLTSGVGDLNGDRRDDLVVRDGRKLLLVPGADGGLGTPVPLPFLWGAYNMVAGGGDLTKDGRPDVVARARRSGMLYIFPGNDNGGLDQKYGPLPGFRGVNFLAPNGDLAGDDTTDLLARATNGKLVVVPHNGNTNVEAVQDTGQTFVGVNLILNVGDWNGDGNGDVMTRVTRTGVMQLRLGDGNGGFAPPATAGTQWGSVKLVAAAGDITGDGYPDLVGQPAGGAMRIYPGDGAGGFLSSFVAHSAIDATGQTGLGLWNSDGSPDTLVRRSDGGIVVYPGNGPGGLMNPLKVGSGAGRYDWLEAVGDANGDGRSDLVAREKSTGTLWLLPGTRSGFGSRRFLAGGAAGFDLVS